MSDVGCTEGAEAWGCDRGDVWVGACSPHLARVLEDGVCQPFLPSTCGGLWTNHQGRLLGNQRLVQRWASTVALVVCNAREARSLRNKYADTIIGSAYYYRPPTHARWGVGQVNLEY